jgi:hypothetical protein
MAGLAFDLGNMLGVRIVLDVGVASVAPKTAVNAGRELFAVDCDAVPCRILHGLVAMTGKAVSLCKQRAWRRGNRHRQQASKHCMGVRQLEEFPKLISESDKNCDEESCDSRGLRHAAVYFPLAQ